jgi:uncharacterized phage protein (TIGR02218 family)
VKDFSPLGITSAAIGFPARIGIITRLDGSVIRFAESDEPIVVDGDTYSVVPGMKVSAVKHTSNGDVPSCRIVGVLGDTFDPAAVDVGLYDAATVQIYFVDRMNLSRKGLLFSGAISDIQVDPIQHQVSFNVKGPSASARVLMTRKRSPMCQTSLFSALCGVDKTAYDVAATVVSIESSFVFTVSGLVEADGYFNQGVGVTDAGAPFLIGKWLNSTQAITTYLPSYRILSVGQGVTLYPGCDKTLGATGCAKFSNQLNFQGQPHFLGTAAAAQQVV